MWQRSETLAMLVHVQRPSRGFWRTREYIYDILLLGNKGYLLGNRAGNYWVFKVTGEYCFSSLAGELSNPYLATFCCFSGLSQFVAAWLRMNWGLESILFFTKELVTSLLHVFPCKFVIRVTEMIVRSGEVKRYRKCGENSWICRDQSSMGLWEQRNLA